MTARTVVFDVNLSLDGFVAAEGSRPGQPLGEGGDRLRVGDRPGRPPRTEVGGHRGGIDLRRRAHNTSLPEWAAGAPHPPTPVFVITHAPPAETPCRQDVEGCE
jgi:hypothetical protein